MILTTDKFRESVFKRDNYQCVFCFSKEKLDAHHIMERRLFDDGGYYVDNGATVCETHHIQCENCTISAKQVREKCNITNVILPQHLYSDYEYDKWGNIDTGTSILPGELFWDESVQKILKTGPYGPNLEYVKKYVKYPRTHHAPWSPKITDDDRIANFSLNGMNVVITEKLDGENTTMTKERIYARSLDSNNHPSRNWVKNYWSSIAYSIPDGWRICGENLYAKHSIEYNDLESYFIGFSIWDSNNICLSWKDTVEYFNILDIKMPRILYEGLWNDYLKDIHKNLDLKTCEGYVIRNSQSFEFRNFRKNVMKWVRPDHVQTHGHWMRSEIVKNKLKE